MAGYAIKPLAELSQRARKYFTQSLPGAIASVWPNTFTIFAKVLALLDFEHEQRRAWLFRQMFASTAEALWLARHAFELGLSRDPGVTAIGSVTVAAAPRMVVPAGLVFLRDDGVTFTTVAGAVASGNSVTLHVEADAIGALGNCPAGLELRLDPTSVAPDGLGTVGVVDAAPDGSGLSGGADAEPVEAFRIRVLERKREPGHGGSAPDYVKWAREALSTVRDVYVDSFENDTRSVWVQATVTDQANGIPTAAQVAILQEYLDDPVRRPVTARVFVTAPIPVLVPVAIRGLSPDTLDIRGAIQAELAAVFIDRAEPGRPTKPFVLSASWISEAISRATGEDRHRRISPADDITFTAGRMPVLGTISYAD